MSIQSSQVPSLGRLRRRARILVRQHQAHDPAVVDLLRTNHPEFADLSPDEIFHKPLHLSDAQLALSREQGKSSGPQIGPLPGKAIGKPRVVQELIPRPEYRRELAARRGLPSVGTRRVSQYGVEYVVIDHGFVLSQAGVIRAGGDEPIPNIDELSPMISLPNMSPRLLDLYAEVDRCTSKILLFFDTMPDKFPRQSAPGLHEVRTTHDPTYLTFHFDASRLHETIIAHELGHLWIEFVEGCEDWRNLRDQSDIPRVVQFQHVQSFVLDLKVNDLLQKRGFDMSVVANDQLKSIQQMAQHCAQGDLPKTKRVAAGLANILAAAVLEQTRWSKSVLQNFQTCLAIIQAAQPELYRLSEQFVASVKRQGYADRDAICRVIDECATLSFQATGDDFAPARDLVEQRPTEWMQDKHPNFLPGFPVAAKLAVWKEAARRGLGTHVQWELGVTASGRVDVRLQDGSGRQAEPIVLSLDVPLSQLDISRLEGPSAVPILSPTPLQRQQPLLPAPLMPALHTPTNLPYSMKARPTRPQMATPSLSIVPSLPWQSGHTQTGQRQPGSSSRRNYMAGVGLWLSRAGFEEQRAGEHPYGYAENNPVMRIDPSGLYSAPGVNCSSFKMPSPPFKWNRRNCQYYITLCN